MSTQPRLGTPRYLVEVSVGGRPPYDGDPVRLGAGSDEYFDDDGFNKVFGGGGDDLIHGQGGDDKLKGGRGNDNLIGGNGSDYLLGGTGDDVLSGEKGRNFYLGGEGSDDIYLDSGKNARVIFRDVFESLPGAEHDTIHRFDKRNGTVLDLRHIDADTLTPENDAFSWIGKAAFSGAAGELRYDPNADGALLQGDVNGDGVADFEVMFLNFSPFQLTVDSLKL